ncbi:putative F-box associated interaction domain-containing protein [Medicago truncatula]|uniref:Putative F-box associated interaction domain-containing protein n=1 Tax=Medicago truncatula TaxID=3880 RepID=A0A396J3Z3_MEDTR|nr:putative F-box associated interaction domain-containing protein [Medicago truncatula]
MSKKHLIVSSLNDSGESFLWDSSISSVFSNASNSSSVTQTQLKCPISLNNYLEICSCDGILCFSFAGHSAFLWNPSLRRYNMLEISIGYDNFNDVYKVVAVSFFNDKNREVNVHTLGTNYWRRIQDFPYSQSIPGPGVFVSGTINWLIYDVSGSCSFHAIVSLDLEIESYQKLSLLHLKKDYWIWTLGVFRDCLCIFDY